MKKIKHIYGFIFIMVLIMSFSIIKVNASNLVNTDYIHGFEQDINNIVDNNIDTFFVLPDFTSYLEFKLDEHQGISSIKINLDDIGYDYEIYSSQDGYDYKKVSFKKSILDKNTEIVYSDISDQFVRIRFVSSRSSDFVHIKDISFLDKDNKRIDYTEIYKEDPLINEYKFYKNDVDYEEAINGLISRVLGEEYVNFFDVELLPDNRGMDYFILSSDDDKIYLKGNNVNSIGVALNYYFEHFLHQTYTRFGDGKLQVYLPLPRVDGVIEKEIDMEYRYNYNYVAYGYTMAYWDFEDWEREIDWMALNGFNMALNLVGQEEVIRRFLSEFGFTFSEIVSYLTSPIYLPWQFMGNITSIGGEITPKWFEDRSKLSIDIQNRMNELGIEPIHQMFVGYFPHKGEPTINTFDGSYWSGIKGPDRIDFNNNNIDYIGKVFYDKQKELLGYSRFFAGDLFHEGGNPYGYNVNELSNKVLDILKDNMGDDAIWVIQSWGHSPSSESIQNLDKDNIIILDLHSQLNVKWKGYSKFNNMSWNSKEFDGSKWIFGVLNNFGGRNGLYGHSYHLIDEFYDAKENSQFLKGIGGTSEGIGFNNFIDELMTELIFKDKLDIDEFIIRYVLNRYGRNDENLVEAFKILVNTVYSAVTDVYHEGASESVINARPSLDIRSASKWGSIHKNYDSKLLEDAFKIYLSRYDVYKNNPQYIEDLIDISSEIIINLANEYYLDIQRYYKSGDIENLRLISNRFLYLIKLQANILSYNTKKSLGIILKDIDKLEYDDYFKDTLKYNKKTIITTWYDKVASEDNGLRDYANTDFYDVVGTLYYNRWDRFFDDLLDDGKLDEKGPYDGYRFDVEWIYDKNSLEFNKSNKSLRDLLDLLLVEVNMNRSDFSFIGNLIYSIDNLMG